MKKVAILCAAAVLLTLGVLSEHAAIAADEAATATKPLLRSVIVGSGLVTPRELRASKSFPAESACFRPSLLA